VLFAGVGVTAPTSIFTFPLLLLVFGVVLGRLEEVPVARCAGNCGMILGGLELGLVVGRLDEDVFFVDVEGEVLDVNAGAV